MFRKKLLNIALEEELETEKILRTSEMPEGKGEFKSLRDKVKGELELKQKEKEDPVESSGSSDSSSSDSSSSDNSDDSGDKSEESDLDDSGEGDEFAELNEEIPSEEDESEESKEDKEEDSKKEEDKDSKKDDEEEDKKDKPATEAASMYLPQTQELLDNEFNVIASSLALENDDEPYRGPGWKSRTWEGIKTIGNVGYIIASALAYIGISIVWPGLKKLYKVFIFLSAKFIRGVHSGSVKLDKLYKDHDSNTEKLKEELLEAARLIATLKEKEKDFKGSLPTEFSENFTKSNIISGIVLGKNTDIDVSIKVLNSFLKDWYIKISKDIDKDTAAILQVLKYGPGAAINPVKVFGDSSMRQGLINDPQKYFPETNGFITSLRYKDTLPGNMLYCAALPNGQAQNLDDIRMAYSASDVGFTLDTSVFEKHDSIKYLTLDKIEPILLSLSDLITTLDTQKKLYLSIKKDKESFMRSLKRYILMVADVNKSISMEKTLLEYIYLRNAFIDNVYITAANDIHIFSQRFIKHVLIYLRENLEKLSE